MALVGDDLQVFNDDESIEDIEVELIVDEFVGELVECLFLLLQVSAQTALLLFGHNQSSWWRGEAKGVSGMLKVYRSKDFLLILECRPAQNLIYYWNLNILHLSYISNQIKINKDEVYLVLILMLPHMRLSYIIAPYSYLLKGHIVKLS